MRKVNNYVRFLVDNGLLFEINRKVLHPLGYSLEAESDDDNRSKIILSKLLDAEDPEGFVYGEESFKENMNVLKQYMEQEGQKRLDNREILLGYIVQED